MYTTCVCNYEYTCTYTRGFDTFEAWAKLPQQWLVCTPLGIHLAQSENCAVPNKKLFGPMVVSVVLG